MLDKTWQECFKFLKATYPKWQPADETEKAWFALLKDLPDPLVQGSVYAWCQNEKFPPSAAELRQQIMNLTISSWEEAFNECLNIANKQLYPEIDFITGRPKEIRFSNPLVAVMYYRYGANSLNVTSRELPFVKNNFEKSYHGLLKEAAKQHMFKKILDKTGYHLPGLDEQPKQLQAAKDLLVSIIPVEVRPEDDGR